MELRAPGAWKRRVTGAAALLGSGVVSGLGLIAIVSDRVHIVDPPVAIALVLFLQWQLMGLTITKVGIDQVVFASISGDAHARPDISEHLRTRAVPLALVFGAVMAITFSPIIAALCSISLVLDTASIIIASDLNARERFTETAIAGLLNYPIFFVALFVLSAVRGATTIDAVLLFVLSSTVRLVWLSRRWRAYRSLPRRSLTPNVHMGVQQTLNYLLFRGDQILLATLIGVRISGADGTGSLLHYLFLARYPDLVSSITVTLGPVFLPQLFVARGGTLAEWARIAAKRWAPIGGYLLAVALPMVIYLQLWSGGSEGLSPLPFVVSAAIVLPANVMTYSLLRRDAVPALVWHLVLAISFGAVLMIAAWLARSIWLLSLLVPTQLLVFMLASALTSRRQQSHASG